MGEWWLRENGGYGRMVDVADVATRCQAVEVARKISTVWRTVATGKRWMWGSRFSAVNVSFWG